MDAIDRKILTVLQEDASLSVADIGSRVGLSSTPCWKRIQRLEADGVILRIGDVRKVVGQSQNEQHGRVAAHGHARLALFDLEERHAADGGALGRNLYRDASSAPRVTDVAPQFAEIAPDRNRQDERRPTCSH